MTMLDRMRRHKGWLKWSLALVVLTFIVFYIPAFLGRGTDGASSDMVARVDGHEISVTDFRRAYQMQLDVYRQAYGANMSEQMLKQLGLDQQILQQMVDEQAAMAEARKRGLSVSDTEVAQFIYSMPEFQENGRFIGQARYTALLRMQRPPMSAEEFENGLRRRLLVNKLQTALTDWVTVPDKDVDQEFKRRNEKVKVELVAFPADKFRSEVTVGDADVASYFEAHKDAYRIGERRKIRYVLVDVEALRAKAVVTAREVERNYNQNAETYSTPEQVRASHILLKTDGKNDAEVKAKAEDLLKQIKGGADFAELAKKNSQDEASAKQGGDLDYFARGRMVPEFDEVAFSLQPGQVSDLVKTQFGYHIIKVVDKKPATTRSLDEVRAQITDQLAWEKAQAQASTLAATLENEIKSPADLDKVAKTSGLKVEESGYFTREEPILGLGPSPQASAEAFDLNQGQVSGAVRTSRGFAFMTVVDKQAPRPSKLEEVKDRVKEDLIREKAKELARQKAAAVASAAKGNGDLAKAAKAAGVEVKTSELQARDAAFPEVGTSRQVDTVAFSQPTGTVSDPIATDNAAVVVKVVEHRDVTPAEVAAGRDQLREELLNERRGRFFSAYMVKAKQRMKIEVNRENMQKVIG